ALLQAVDRRVFAEDIVADLGGGDRGSHAGGRPGHGITAQIEETLWHDETNPLERTWPLAALQNESCKAASGHNDDVIAALRFTSSFPDMVEHARPGSATRRSSSGSW